jgi:orotidine-5'-phosphate decarboxylase
MPEHFADRLVEAIREKKSVLCVGLDPQLRLMPRDLLWDVIKRPSRQEQMEWIGRILSDFNRSVIDAVAEHAVAVKPNIGFYLPYGAAGFEAFEHAVTYARVKGLVVINDAKCDDGDDTAWAHAGAHIGFATGITIDAGVAFIPSAIRADAVTVEPRLGDNCLEPFVSAVKERGTGVFVFVRTSFKKPGGIEDLELKNGSRVWQYLVDQTAEWAEEVPVGQHGYRSLGAVVGANKDNPDDAQWIRKRLWDSWFLVPGIGAQGAAYAEAVKGANKDGMGVLVNSGRSILYAGVAERHHEDPITREQWIAAVSQAALTTKDGLNAALARAGKPLA